MATQPADGHEAKHVNGGFAHTQPQCRDGELLWIDIVAPEEKDYQMLVQRFHLHPMVVEDMKSHEGRPKLHDYGDYLYIIFHALMLSKTNEAKGSSHEIHLCEIDCLVGPDYVVTIHPLPVQPFEDLAQRWESNRRLMDSGAGYLLYELMDEVLDDYFPLLDHLDERIDEFQDRLFQEFEEELSGDIFALKRSLLKVRRVAGPTRDVVNILLRRDADAGSRHFAYFQDLYDHTNRIVDMTDTFRELLSGALDAYLAMASNRMNAIMKTLTSASIILLIPTLIAGIYGMNFVNMPELHNPHGYHTVLGVMFGITVGLGVYFKQKRWL